ncbi:hypothetical protein [Pseudodesulfovibrio piezophilus]|uniref:hypothetical protein n=1 Tax=Pseudodesulfovibrio piezophilus TaxID=879567 RepID=UPI0012FF0BB7|nr:hypothetical protein [Pseudodesulfovibrio piezophilus]
MIDEIMADFMSSFALLETVCSINGQKESLRDGIVGNWYWLIRRLLDNSCL